MGNISGCKGISTQFGKKKLWDNLPYNAQCNMFSFIEVASEGGKWYKCCHKEKGSMLMKLAKIFAGVSNEDLICKEVTKVSDDGQRICFTEAGANYATYDETESFNPQLDKKECIDKGGTDKWAPPEMETRLLEPPDRPVRVVSIESMPASLAIGFPLILNHCSNASARPMTAASMSHQRCPGSSEREHSW